MWNTFVLVATRKAGGVRKSTSKRICLFLIWKWRICTVGMSRSMRSMRFIIVWTLSGYISVCAQTHRRFTTHHTDMSKVIVDISLSHWCSPSPPLIQVLWILAAHKRHKLRLNTRMLLARGSAVGWRVCFCLLVPVRPSSKTIGLGTFALVSCHKHTYYKVSPIELKVNRHRFRNRLKCHLLRSITLSLSSLIAVNGIDYHCHLLQ
jgi:hypothetical protein